MKPGKPRPKKKTDQLVDPATMAPDDVPEDLRSVRRRRAGYDPTAPSFIDTSSVDVVAEGGRGRVLVADDDKTLRGLIRGALQRAGYEVFEAADGLAALAAVKAGGIDLALLDVQMPGADGIEVCTEIRREHDSLSLPVIIVTGLDDRDARVWCKAVGADEFLTKPMDVTELLIRVENLLKLSRYHVRLLRQNEHLEDAVRVRTARIRAALDDAELQQRRLRHVLGETFVRLSAAVEFRDLGSAQHVERIGIYAKWLAKLAGLPDELCVEIAAAAALHDVGMIAVSSEIITHPGSLSSTQRALMERHPHIGSWILGESKVPELNLACGIAASHHEWWDGTGYPEGLTGNTIPIGARIVAIGDVFDALISKRPWRPAHSIEDAFDLIRVGAGVQFDPTLAAVLLGNRDVFENIAGGGDPEPDDDGASETL
jgi:putative two-component system response regulator